MSAQRPMVEDRLKQALRDLLRREAEVSAPERLTVAVDETLRTTPLPDRRGRLPKAFMPKVNARLTSSWSVMAGILVALAGGFLLVAALTTQQSDPRPAAVDTASPSASPSGFRLPAVLPDDIESGTLETPAGPARWIHLSDEASTLPRLGHVFPWPGGLAAFEPPDGGDGILWATEDGIGWRAESLPFLGDAKPASLTFDDGVYWLHADSCGASGDDHVPNVHDWCLGTDRLWRSSDASAWEEIDLAGLAPFQPSGYPWGWGELPPIASPVTAGDVTLTVATSVGHFGDLAAMFHEDPGACDHGPLESRGDGRYQLGCDEGTGPVMRFEETDTGLRVIDDGSGDELGEVPAADMQFVRWLSGEERGPLQEERWFAIQRLFKIDDGTIEPIDVPWSPYDYAQLFAIGDMVYAYVLEIEGESGESVAGVAVYSSSDGRTWTDLGQAELIGGIPESLAPSSIVSVPGGIAANLSVPQETADGTRWQPAPEGPEGSRPYRTEAGWFANRPDSPGDPEEWWMRVGEAWVSLAELGMDRSSDWCVAWPTSIGTTTIFTAAMDERCARDSFDMRRRPTEMWILELGSTE